MKTSWCLLVASCSIMLAGCNSAQSNAGPGGGMPAITVKTSRIASRILSDNSAFVGTVKSRMSVNVKPQVAGRILKIFVRSGDDVAAGSPLLELDKMKQEALVSNASAAIESNLAEQENASATVKSLESTRASKLETVAFAKKQLERYKLLADEGAVSTEQVDTWRNRVNIAQAELEAVDSQIRAQKATLVKDEKLIMQAKAAMKEQKEELRYFTVRAPFAGEVGDIPVRLGDYVTTDTQLTTIDQTDKMELYISVPTADSYRLHKGLSVEIIGKDGAVQKSGKIFFVAAQVDPKDQSILAKAEIANPDESLRSGEEVNARIVWGNVPSLTVPVTAVTRFTGQDFVFVVDRSRDGKAFAKQKAVKLASIEGNEYRVVSGLQQGDEVVTSGTQNLADGAPVKTGS